MEAITPSPRTDAASTFRRFGICSGRTIKTGKMAETQSVHIWLMFTTYVLIIKSLNGKQVPL